MRLEVLMEKRNRKRKSILLVLLMFTCLIWNSTLSVKAENEKKIGESYLTHEEEAEVTTPKKVTRGEDLMTGYSKIRRMGPEKLYAGGSSIASHTVERIGVAVMVDRAIPNGSFMKAGRNLMKMQTVYHRGKKWMLRATGITGFVVFIQLMRK